MTDTRNNGGPAATFENGRNYYTRDGRKVTYISPTDNDRHVVAQVVEIQTYDGWEEADGPITIETELFAKAPREIVDEDLRKAEARLQEVENLRISRTSDALSAEREVRQRLDALKKFKGLERLEDFIEGRITHVLCPGEYGGDYEIKTLNEFEEVEYGRSKGLKLISLFGTSKGDLNFRVNQYRDGSGSGWREIIPCASVEEAEAKRQERIAADLAEQSESFDPAKPHYFMVRMQAALKYGVPVSESDMARYRDCEAQSIARQRAAVEKEIADRQRKLEQLQPLTARSPSSKEA